MNLECDVFSHDMLCGLVRHQAQWMQRQHHDSCFLTKAMRSTSPVQPASSEKSRSSVRIKELRVVPSSVAPRGRCWPISRWSGADMPCAAGVVGRGQ